MCAFFMLAASGQHALSQVGWKGNDERQRGYASAGTLWQGNDWLGGGGTQQRSQWRLGVTGDNVDVGVLVRRVSPGSAAARANIEVGDVIVSVGGYQVGMVDGRLYDLAEEINRQADSDGNVAMVIQDHRSLRLSSVRVKLGSSQQSLTGQLVYRDRTPFPSDAIVTVQIENLTRPYYTVRNGQAVFRPSAAGTIPFEISYDPSYIHAQDTYQVRAFVTSRGRTILDTLQPQRVLTNGNPSFVRLRLASIGSIANNPGNGVVTAGYPNFNAVDDQLVQLYRRYLGRTPSVLELAALRSTPDIQRRLEQMPLELMAAQEYFDAAGNNNRVWLEKVFGEIVRRQPTRSELEQWLNRYADLRFSRTELLRQLYSVAPQ